MSGTLLEQTSLLLEVLGAAVIVCGIALAALTALRAGTAPQRFSRVRRTMGRGILLGLEVLVAADIIRTVAVTPTLESVVVLAVIVLIRTFLSFSLSVEIDGILPWRRGVAENASPTSTDLGSPPGSTRVDEPQGP